MNKKLTLTYLKKSKKFLDKHSDKLTEDEVADNQAYQVFEFDTISIPSGYYKARVCMTRSDWNPTLFMGVSTTLNPMQ